MVTNDAVQIRPDNLKAIDDNYAVVFFSTQGTSDKNRLYSTEILTDISKFVPGTKRPSPGCFFYTFSEIFLPLSRFLKAKQYFAFRVPAGYLSYRVNSNQTIVKADKRTIVYLGDFIQTGDSFTRHKLEVRQNFASARVALKAFPSLKWQLVAAPPVSIEGYNLPIPICGP